MKRVLVVHPQFRFLGGAELVAIHVLRWLLLQKNINITLLTLRPVNFSRVHRFTNVTLPWEKLTIRIANCPSILRYARGRFELLKLSFLHRAARNQCAKFDLCISTYNEMDFGKRGVQYVHHPSFAQRMSLRKFHIIEKTTILDRFPPVNKLYRSLVFAISGDSVEGYKSNVTLANSRFTNEIMKEIYDLDGHVVYPALLPDSDNHTAIEWERREFRFISVGRIARDKDYDFVLDTFGALSRRFQQASFLIVGTLVDGAYQKILCDKAKRLGVPLTIKNDVTKQELDSLLGASKFYIHSKREEHFGISVIEAAHAGCLPFVFDSGGTRETIIPTVLRFTTSDELILQIEELLSDLAKLQSTMQEVCNSASRFQASAFDRDLDRLIGPMLE